MRATPSSARRLLGGTPSMTMTLTGSAGGRIGLGSLERLGNGPGRVIAMLEEHVRSGIDEELHAPLLCRVADCGDALRLAGNLVETGALDDAVLEIDADHTEIEEARYVARQLVIDFAIAAFEVDGDRRVYGRGDPTHYFLGERD